MGYNSEKKLITKPIDTTDIAAALGVSSKDVGALCSSARINKWSKFKPIRYAQWRELELWQREGMPSDTADNVHFGIKINGPVNGILDSNIVAIHDTAFEYLQPRGGAAEPFRMTDFDGYKHDAYANPGASFQISAKGGILEGNFDDEDHQYGSLRNLVVQYDNTNTYGVDFTDMLKDTAETLQNALSRAYPCILVTDSRGRSFFTALDYPGDLLSAPAARPLYYNGAYQRSSNWSVRFGKPVLSNGLNPSTTKPWTSPQEGMRATLFLVKAADIYGPYLDFAKTQNFAENWISLAADSAFVGVANPVVLPADILGAPLVLTSAGSAEVYYEPTGVRYLDPLLTVDYIREGDTENAVTLECTATIGGIRAVRTMQITPGGAAPVLSFSASDFGLLAFKGGGEYTVSVMMKTTDSKGTTTKAGSFTFNA